MTIRIKDKKCEMLRRIKSGVEKYYQRVPGRLWCYTKQEKVDSVRLPETPNYFRERRLFILNPGVKIIPGDLITYRGFDYEIDQVDTVEDYRGEVYVHGELVPGGKVDERYKVDEESQNDESDEVVTKE